MRILITVLVGVVLSVGSAVSAAVPTTINDFVMPGSQPNQSGNLESPDKCDNCHGGYDLAVEPAFNWRGSMMSQAARDPLLYAGMAVANQDAPESGDLCLRCHTPPGWLGGRSTPTDGSALTTSDRESVSCDFCHKLVTPTPLGVNPYPDDSAYTAGTYDADQTYLATLATIPTHSANGMYIADANNAKRGPFVDAEARHQFYYSPFHPEADLCGTCHDVSNPAFSRDSSGAYVPNDFDTPPPDQSPYAMFPVERTFSEWLHSAYNTPEGVYGPQFGGNKDTVRTCQDCHMRDVTGFGCNKAGAPERDNLPLHDLTGGNTFIPLVIDAVFPGETDPAALDSGRVRAVGMLQKAATMDLSAVDDGGQHELTVQITNETGHKLPSGYPEGRRIWINVQAFNASDQLIYESGAYDTSTGVLTHDAEVKIYEIEPGISNSLSPVVGLPAGQSFHFVLNDTVYSDNRIPPRGFTNAAFDSIQSPPVAYTYADGQYWDETDYGVPGSAAKVVVTLYYQTTSKEYVEFLRDANVTNDWGTTLYDLWDANGKSAPIAMVKDSIALTPIGGNQPPVLSPIGPKETDEGVLLSFTVTATDPNGTTPSLTTSTLPTGAQFVDSGNGVGSFEWTPTYDQAGVYPVTFYATDDSAAVDSEEVQITVHNVNRPPVLLPIGPKETDEGVLLAFTVTATDPDGTIPDLTTSTLPTGAQFVDSGNGVGSFEWTPTYDQAGVYPVTFYATDDSAAVDSEEVQITVHDVGQNEPPVLSPIGPKETDEGVLLSFTVTATDPNGTIPSLTTSTLPTGAQFVDSGNGVGSFEWTPDYDQAGVYPVTFYATDDSAAVDSEEVQITVHDVNRAPVIDPVSPQTVTAGQLLAFIIHATDPDGDAVTLAAENMPDGAVFVDSGDGLGGFEWIPQSADTGLHTPSFLASAAGLTDTLEVDITVLHDGCCAGIRGNVDNDPEDAIDIGDLVWLVDFMFTEGPPPACLTEADMDASGELDISDLVYLIDYMFNGGALPADCP